MSGKRGVSANPAGVKGSQDVYAEKLRAGWSKLSLPMKYAAVAGGIHFAIFALISLYALSSGRGFVGYPGTFTFFYLLGIADYLGVLVADSVFNLFQAISVTIPAQPWIMYGFFGTLQWFSFGYLIAWVRGMIRG
ncbi:hypothetical protein HYX10_02310 [Candidatus Woesearchaeota archaeon]|nr:hypothetical protein [Candidatus Woesearchaeota archaeon]